MTLMTPQQRYEWHQTVTRSGVCDCMSCCEVRKTITYPQPTRAEAMQQALAVVGKKYFSGDKATQPVGNPPVSIGEIAAERLFLTGARQAGKQWARDVWIDEHEAQLAGANKPDIDQINDLLSEISDSDRRIQHDYKANEKFWIENPGSGYTTSPLIEKAIEQIDAESKVWEEEDRYDRIKLEAHQARLDRNNSYESRFDTKPWIEKELAVIDTQRAMAKAMQQPTQTELSMNDQVLSARYGRNDG